MSSTLGLDSTEQGTEGEAPLGEGKSSGWCLGSQVLVHEAKCTGKISHPDPRQVGTALALAHPPDDTASALSHLPVPIFFPLLASGQPRGKFLGWNFPPAQPGTM